MSEGYTLEDYESELFHDMISDIKGGADPSNNSSAADPDPEPERRASNSSDETSSGDEFPDITSSGDEAPDISDSESEPEDVDMDDQSQPEPVPEPQPELSKVEVSDGPDFDDDAELEKEGVGVIDVEDDADFDNDDVEGVEVEEMEEEFILDDEEFVIQEGSVIKILEEEAIPEEKVILNDRDQELDLFNELMKTVDEKYRENPKYVKKISNMLNNYVFLKYNHSVFTNGEVSAPNFKTDDYKPLALDDKIFEKNYYLPVLNESKDIYYPDEGDDVDDVKMLLSSTTDKTNKLFNFEKIDEQNNIRTKFRKREGRFNYSYKNEINELYESANSYKSLGTNGYTTNFKNPKEVLRFCEEEDCTVVKQNLYTNDTFERHRLGGELKTELSETPIVNGERSNIVGFLKLSSDMIADKMSDKMKYSTLIDSINSMDFYHESLREKFSEKILQNLSLSFSVGDDVRICYTNDTQTEVDGTILDITEDEYIIRPADESQLETVKVKRRDGGVIVTRDLDVSLTGEHCDINNSNLVFYIFPNKNITKDEYNALLNQIVPSPKRVILSNLENLSTIQSLEELEEILRLYSLTLNDLTNNNFSPAREILNQNIDKIVKLSKQKQAEFIKFKKEYKPEVNRTSVKLINKGLLDSVAEFYGRYPFYNKSVDSLEMRLNWIKEHYDHGTLFFKEIVINMMKGIDKSRDVIIDGIRKAIMSLESKLIEKKNKLDTYKSTLLSEEERKCPEHRIVKDYKSLESLEADNYKQIAVDSDKIVYGREEGNIVKVGNYALLDIEGSNRQLWKRITPGDGREMWAVEHGAAVDVIVNSNRDFCNNQGKLLQMFNKKTLADAKCIFSEEEQECLPKEVFNLIEDIEKIQLSLDEKRENLSKMELSSIFVGKNEKFVEKLKNTLVLHEDFARKNYLYNLEKVEEIKKTAEDSEYSDLYEKIDRFLKMINSLSEEEMYPKLEILLSKYGREAEVTKGENPLNVYCKVGSKTLTCVHHARFIEYYRNGVKHIDVLNNIVKDFGVERDGMYYCINCGQEIIMSGYETVEGFTKSGARDVTHEELAPDEEDETSKPGGSEKEGANSLESIMGFLNEDDKRDLVKENTVDVLKIINVLLNMTGITMRDVEKATLVKNSVLLSNSNIKSKHNWMAGQKKLPKNVSGIDKMYMSYVAKNTILFTTAALFVALQTAVPSYKVLKAHTKCVSSLDGYPLAENPDDKSGIVYFACLLENLRESNGYWSAVKKLKIPEALTKIINVQLKDQYVENLYKVKRSYIAEKEEEIKRFTPKKWTEFKPPLDNFEIEISELSLDQTKLYIQSLAEMDIVSKRESFEERILLLSMKKIQLIDSVIATAPIENPMFNPTPVGNSCCLDTLGNDYSYLSYFDESKRKEIMDIDASLNHLHSIKSEFLGEKNLKTIIVKPERSVFAKFETFNKDVFPRADEITAEMTASLHATFSPNGEKHIYDENKISVVTGEPYKSFMEREYTNVDYENLLNGINKSKLFEIDYRGTLPDNSINLIKQTIQANSTFRNDEYLNKMVTNLEEALKNQNIELVEAAWKDLQNTILVEVDTLVGVLTQKLNIREKQKIDRLTYIFKHLGEIKDIFENEPEYFYKKKEQNIRRYFKLLNDALYKIKYNKCYDETLDNAVYIPHGWKLDESYKKNLERLLISETNKYAKFVNTKTTNDSLLFDTLISLVNNSNNFLDLLTGKNHKMKCDGSYKFYSDLTYSNAANILHYMFIVLISKMANEDESTVDASLGAPVTMLDDDRNLLDDLEEERGDESAPVDETGEVELMEGLQTQSKSINTTKMEFLRLFLDNLYNHQMFFEKHTQQYIEATIEKKSDIEKEENLKFIEQLNKEARQSFKTMIAIGLDSWKKLTTKDKSLYFETAIAEDEADHNLSNEDLDAQNRMKAANELGENFSEEQYNDWLSRQSHHAREDQLAHDEMEVMEDDDE